MARKISKILMIDDEPLQHEIVKDLLGYRKYDFVTAEDGEEGIQKAYQENPDLIIVDLLMPKKDGFDVCRALRENPETSQIPIILLSGFDAENFEERSKLFGADAMIRKSANLAVLTGKVREALESN